MELLKSEVLIDNETFRFDSEFQKKEYVNCIEKVSQYKNSSLNDHLELLTDGKHGGVKLVDKGVLFLRTTNIQENKIDLSDLRFISEKESEETLRAEFKTGDLLLTTIGTIGLCAKVPEHFPRATINQNLVRIVLKDKSKSSLICCFLNSKYGRNQLLRYGAGNVYQMINYPNLKKILIPNFSELPKKIDEFYLLSEQKTNQSKTLYKEAEALLLDEVGLTDFQPTQKAVNIKSFGESFGTSGRLDAEYYQPFYEDVEHILKKKGVSLLKDICSKINYGTVPTSPYTDDGSGVPYIKGLNLKNTEISKHKLDRITDVDSLDDRFYTKKGDIIISQMGTVGDVGVVRNEENWLFASFTIRARLKNFETFNPYFVGLYIQNIAKKYYLYRNIAQASVRQNTDLPTIKNLYIPIIPIKKQTQIAKKIEQSFALKQESERLLQIAKQAVEMAIEKGEDEAMGFVGEKQQFSVC